MIIDNDIDAWRAFPESRWMFNKLFVLTSLGVECGPLGTEDPKHFPIWVKPVVNVWGMGIGAKVYFSPEEVSYEPGMMWMKYLQGASTYSYDVEINEKNEIIRGYVAVGKNGPFYTSWHVDELDLEDEHIQEYVTRLGEIGKLPRFLNFEVMARQIIECHPRWSKEFIFHYGDVPFVQYIKWSKTLEQAPPEDYIDCRLDDTNLFLKKKRIGIKYQKKLKT